MTAPSAKALVERVRRTAGNHAGRCLGLWCETGECDCGAAQSGDLLDQLAAIIEEARVVVETAPCMCGIPAARDSICSRCRLLARIEGREP
ncbi:MAG: hypothetical protein ACK4N5_05355 [Myxococcales bacterium]